MLKFFYGGRGFFEGEGGKDKGIGIRETAGAIWLKNCETIFQPDGERSLHRKRGRPSLRNKCICF